MRNICMLVSYDGTGYYGYQSQPGGNTVQDHLEDAIRALTGEKLKIHGSGRTDAGVHAAGQVVHFHTESKIPAERWALALNTRLPDDIVVRAAVEVPLAFHSRRSAIRKTYKYAITSCRFPDVFDRKYVFHHPAPLRFSAMQEGLAHLLGEHDFSSFTSPLSTKPHHVRTLYEARLDLEPGGDGEIGQGRGKASLVVSGNGFLYNMVRIIAGTLMQVGEGKRRPEEMGIILAARNRAKAGPTAVPHGLTLMSVEYGPEWGIDWKAAILRRH
ncbi:tRNA pseudouridine(38-40) synthase TruA [Cohnella fermenti]|uniref:tRNA pseudouridine synthase A n=1 Tax=Cohnella fermenti TaxID=2565925 RepID=A0A4S4BVK7_9BACL|nr:tRNA pseudouridine(38-40) synthase TruA [Cohnella fermenti]THF79190.1 tRNA pseudouridine(38-40) synthase TruA [Cohnella fermenti]